VIQKSGQNMYDVSRYQTFLPRGGHGSPEKASGSSSVAVSRYTGLIDRLLSLRDMANQNEPDQKAKCSSPTPDTIIVFFVIRQHRRRDVFFVELISHSQVVESKIRDGRSQGTSNASGRFVVGIGRLKMGEMGH